MNAIPMIVACCIGQGCNRAPWELKLPRDFWERDERDHPSFYESSVLDDRERH